MGSMKMELKKRQKAFSPSLWTLVSVYQTHFVKKFINHWKELCQIILNFSKAKTYQLHKNTFIHEGEKILSKKRLANFRMIGKLPEKCFENIKHVSLLFDIIVTFYSRPNLRAFWERLKLHRPDKEVSITNCIKALDRSWSSSFDRYDHWIQTTQMWNLSKLSII